MKFSYRLKDERKYGIVSGKIIGAEDGEDYIVQLMPERSNQPIAEAINSSSYSFDFVKPQKLRVRVIHDVNKNGVWDIGDFRERKPHEPIYFYDKVIDLRPNWEVADTDIDVSVD